MAKKIYDSDLLHKLEEAKSNQYYWLGAYTYYNGLDIKNAQNIFFIDEERYKKFSESTTYLNDEKKGE